MHVVQEYRISKEIIPRIVFYRYRGLKRELHRMSLTPVILSFLPMRVKVGTYFETLSY